MTMIGKAIAAAVLALGLSALYRPAQAHPFAALATEQTGKLQQELAGRPLGYRIGFWAEQFLGAPYDTDPLGEYVRTEKIVCDSRVDCMYLVFRAVELALTKTPDQAEQAALELRFITRGSVAGGKVVNYGERFQYAEDMITSGKWGRDITEELGLSPVNILTPLKPAGVTMISRVDLMSPLCLESLNTGDLIFFVVNPARHPGGEIVGHLGIIKMEGRTPWLIHAHGSKTSDGRVGGGEVVKVPLADYFASMKFIGAKVTRLAQPGA